MNHLVFVNAREGELEKILSGVKRMIVMEKYPQDEPAPLEPGDSLYFLRDNGEDTLRVKASVQQVIHICENLPQELPTALKEMQTRLQLTENQYNRLAGLQSAWIVEFIEAHKINEVRVDLQKVRRMGDRIVFKEMNEISAMESVDLTVQNRKGVRKWKHPIHS